MDAKSFIAQIAHDGYPLLWLLWDTRTFVCFSLHRHVLMRPASALALHIRSVLSPIQKCPSRVRPYLHLSHRICVSQFY